MKFSIEDFFSKCDQETADLVTFTKEILNGKLHFFVQRSLPLLFCKLLMFVKGNPDREKVKVSKILKTLAAKTFE